MNQIFFEIFWWMRSHEDLFWRSIRDLILLKIFAEFKRKTSWRLLEKNILWRFWSKLFLLKIFKRLIFFKRSSIKFFLKYFWDLWKIFNSNILEIFGRSSVQDLENMFKEDLLKISKRTINEILLTSRKATMVGDVYVQMFIKS